MIVGPELALKVSRSALIRLGSERLLHIVSYVQFGEVSLCGHVLLVKLLQSAGANGRRVVIINARVCWRKTVAFRSAFGHFLAKSRFLLWDFVVNTGHVEVGAK